MYPSMAGLVIAHSVLVLPYVVSIVVANLKQVQIEQEEAARDPAPMHGMRFVSPPSRRFRAG